MHTPLAQTTSVPPTSPAMTCPAPAPSSASLSSSLLGRPLTSSESSYLHDLTSWSMSRLSKEPRLLAARREGLHRRLEEVSVEHYPTLLTTQQVMTKTHTEIQTMEECITQANTTHLPELQQAMNTFMHSATGIQSHLHGLRRLSTHQSSLLDLLEVPSLMDSCFKNGLIHEALQLDVHVKEVIDGYRRNAMSESMGMGMSIDTSKDRTDADDVHRRVGLAADGVPTLLHAISGELDGIKRNIVNSLLTQLRGPLNVESGFPIVALLKRTLSLFDTNRSSSTNSAILLKYQFLAARNHYFEQSLQALKTPPVPTDTDTTVQPPTHTHSHTHTRTNSINTGSHATTSSTLNASVFKYLDEYLYLTRTNLFDIITLYTALFLDTDDHNPHSNSNPDTTSVEQHSTSNPKHTQTPASSSQEEELSLLCRWAHARIDIMLNTLNTYLPYVSDGSSLFDLLQSSMEYGHRLSRTKIGLDFRPLLVPIFERCILDGVRRGIDGAIERFDQHLDEYPLIMQQQQLTRLGITLLDQPPSHATLIPLLQPLLQYPALAMLADELIATVNSLSKCNPLSLTNHVIECCTSGMEECTNIIKKRQSQARSHTKDGKRSVPGESGGGGRSVANTNASSPSPSSSSPSASSDPLVQLSHGFCDHFLSFIQTLIARVYPDAKGLFPLSRLQSSLAAIFAEEERVRRWMEEKRKQQQQATMQADEESKVNAVDHHHQQQQDLGSKTPGADQQQQQQLASAAVPIASSSSAAQVLTAAPSSSSPMSISASEAESSPTPAPTVANANAEANPTNMNDAQHPHPHQHVSMSSDALASSPSPPPSVAPPESINFPPSASASVLDHVHEHERSPPPSPSPSPSPTRSSGPADHTQT